MINIEARMFLNALDDYREALVKAYHADVVIWESLKKLRKYFDKKTYLILKIRYKEHATLEEAGKRFGVTRERIRQMEYKALETLAKMADES